MSKLLFTGMTAGLAASMIPAMATAEPTTPAVSKSLPVNPYSTHRWGSRVDGRWRAGYGAPGGWAAYRRPVRGFALPHYWVQPGFYIADYALYSLPAPQPGYGWSRYYDDAVLTDRYGRVYDSRGDIGWDRYEGGYDDEPAVAHAMPPPEAGPPPPPGHRRPYDESVVSSNEYRGRWVGTWYGADGRVYSGDYDGAYQGTVNGADMNPPPHDRGPHWRDGGAYDYDNPGNVYYVGPGVTTIVVQPAVTTTTTYYDEEVIPVRKAWKPRRKAPARCGC
jgi:Ni/Co efflux regulator RcnB